MVQEVYLIFDIGKTNKKCFVFREDGVMIGEYTERFQELEDEDGFPCEDISKLSTWVLRQYKLLRNNESYRIKAINFATYGASFVFVNETGKVLAPLYNYLKPFPENIKHKFLESFFKGDAKAFVKTTASPWMGMLNSGLQLYLLKQTKPAIWSEVKYALHLPQYLHFLFTKKFFSDFTSVGCHTGMWDAAGNNYHQWLEATKVAEKLPPIHLGAIGGELENIQIGVGLHDSSAALIPYLKRCTTPFLLISTGTWCINLNPFNSQPLTCRELEKDVLIYLQPDGSPVKASRVFLGREHEFQTKRIAAHFNVGADFYNSLTEIKEIATNDFIPACMEGNGPQPQQRNGLWEIKKFENERDAYQSLMVGLSALLIESVQLVLTNSVKSIFIDGGFAANKLLNFHLQKAFPNLKIIPVEFPQATALGAFLHIQGAINKHQK